MENEGFFFVFPSPRGRGLGRGVRKFPFSKACYSDFECCTGFLERIECETMQSVSSQTIQRIESYDFSNNPFKPEFEIRPKDYDGFLRRFLQGYQNATYMRLEDLLNESHVHLSHNGYLDTDFPFDELTQKLSMGEEEMTRHRSGKHQGHVQPRESELGNISAHLYVEHYSECILTDKEPLVVEKIFSLPQGTFQSKILDCHSGTSLSRKAQTRVTKFLELAVKQQRKIFIRKAQLADENEIFVYNGFEI